MADPMQSEPSGSLFQGLKFWFSTRVNGRLGLKAQVEENGGIVLQVEKGADIKIVNPDTQQSIPGGHSPSLIEYSIRKGVLEDLEDHLVGPPAGAPRDVGSVIQPSKRGRTQFTAEDDKILIEWVIGEESRGKATKGNEIYKQLERKNSRHTWQAWRDRWVKQLKDRPRPPQVSTNAPPTPPLDGPADDAVSPGEQGEDTEPDQDVVDFTDEHRQALLAVAPDLVKLPPEQADAAWGEWASKYYKQSGRSAEDWREFWENDVCPLYLRQQRRESHQGSHQGSRLGTRTLDRVKSESSPSYGLDSSRLASEIPLVEQPLKLEDSGEAEFYDAVQSLHSDELTPEYQQEVTKLTHSAMAEEVQHHPLSKTVDLPNHLGSSIGHQTPSKKRFAEDIEIPSSSPITATVLRHKRPRLEDKAPERKEIPSTPERRPVTIEETPTNLLSDNIIDLESDNESVIEATETDNDVPHQPSQSLSEPDQRHSHNGELLFENFQRRLDYSNRRQRSPRLNEDDYKDHSEEDEPTPCPKIQPRGPTQDTQAILTGPTQLLDFSIPDPDDDYLLRSSSPTIPPSSQTITSQRPIATAYSSQTLNAALDAWIDAKVAAGNSLDAIHIALQATTMNISLAEVVLDYVTAHDGTEVPANMAGVWTKQDDEDIFAVDARQIARADRKHGGEALAARMDFLREYNRTDDETEDDEDEER